MTVVRFRDFESASRALWRDRSDPRLMQAIKACWLLAARLVGSPLHDHGLRKFRTIEEANVDHDQAVERRIRRIRADLHAR